MMQWVARGYFYSSQNPFYQELLHSLLTTFFIIERGKSHYFGILSQTRGQRMKCQKPQTYVLISGPRVGLNFSMVANHWSNNGMETIHGWSLPQKTRPAHFWPLGRIELFNGHQPLDGNNLWLKLTLETWPAHPWPLGRIELFPSFPFRTCWLPSHPRTCPAMVPHT